MSLELCLALAGVLLLPLIFVVPLLALIVFLILLPRRITRQVRYRLMDFNLWQWVQGSHISAKIHKWLENGNGNGKDQA